MAATAENEADYVHKCRPLDRETDIDIIGLYRWLPVAYAGFSLCPCPTLRWEYLYVPLKLRKLGIGPVFVGRVMHWLRENFPGKFVDTEAALSNRALMALMERYNFEVTYVTGVKYLEKLPD
jgi:hypothetical protein